MFLHEWIPPRVLFQTDILTISTYGLCIAGALVVGYGVTFLLARMKGERSTRFLQDIDVLTLLLVVGGTLGARTLFVAYHWEYFATRLSEIPAVWQGGWVWQGGYLFGLLVLFMYARLKKMSFLFLADMCAPGVILAHAVGRWGNYFNQEAYGLPTGLPWGIAIQPEYRMAGYEAASYFHPTFLYESLFNAFLGIILVSMMVRVHQGKHRLPPGSIFFISVIAYSTARFFLEFLRIDSVPIVAGLRAPQLVSIIMIGFVIALFIYVRRSAIKLLP